MDISLHWSLTDILTNDRKGRYFGYFAMERQQACEMIETVCISWCDEFGFSIIIIQISCTLPILL